MSVSLSEVEAALRAYMEQTHMHVVFVDGTEDDLPMVAAYEVPTPESAAIVVLGVPAAGYSRQRTPER